MNKKKRKRTHFEEENNRIAIHQIYKISHYKNHNNDNDLPKIVTTISNVFDHEISRSVIHRVCSESKVALDYDASYNPSRKTFQISGKRKIEEGSRDEHLITVLKEKTGYDTATHLFNLLVATPQGREQVGVHSVWNAIQRTSHSIQCPQKVTQASNDRLIWKRARLIYCIQYLVRLNELDIEEIIEKVGSEDEEYRQNFTREKLLEKNLTIDDIYRIAFWDETHFQQEVGESRDMYITFPRDQFGTYDPDREDSEEEYKRVS